MLIYKDMMNKRVFKFLFIIIMLIILFIVFLAPRNYNIDYNVNDYKVVESFDKTNEIYSFYIVKNDLEYEININSSYVSGKKLVKDVKEYESDDTKCIVLVSDNDKLKMAPLCTNNNQNIDYYESDVQIDGYSKDKNYDEKNINDLTLYNILDKKYFIWNYHNYIYIDSNKSEEIQLFDNDYYNIDLAAKVDDYLVIPNYDSGYEFQEMYIINANNLKKETWKLNYEMSVDSSVVGVYDGSLYIVDKKDKIEYELNIKKKQMKIVGTESRGALYYDQKFETISMNKLINDNLKFKYDNKQEFVLDNKKLYLKTVHTNVLLSDDVDFIVESNQYYVLYLIKDTLYYYDIYQGNVKVMKNFEWNFNKNNMIFVY